MFSNITFKQKLNIKFKIINALIYRELITRLSKNASGVFGIFAESFVTIFVFVILFSIIRTSSIGGLNIYIFLTCGIVIFNLFNSISVRSSNSLKANSTIISSFKNIEPLDTVLSRAIVELNLYFIVF